MTRASRAPGSIAASILGVVIAGTGGLLLAGRVVGRSNPGAAEVSVFKREAMAVIRFQGSPRGGGLTISVKGRRLQIDTRPGERLDRIAARAAALINADREMSRQQITAGAEGSELTIQTLEAWVFLCSADQGLEVPLPPRDLKVEWTSDGLAHLSWTLPAGGYDRIHILRGNVPIADGIGGANTRFEDFAQGERMTYVVFGIRHRVPSCAVST